jgi:subtilisin family serine protease
VVWAVLDSGIAGDHIHFQKHKNLYLKDLDPPLRHKDFTNNYISDSKKAREEEHKNALTDNFGHGTHVAGIIAGEATTEMELRVLTRRRDEAGNVQPRNFKVSKMSGMAPECKLVSIKVLDDDGKGRMSNILAAIAEIQEINEHGRWLKVHGVNLSLGYDFEPEWFACGQSPLCLEVDRLVKSGVVVVTAAGNTGYGFKQTSSRGAVAAGMLMSINDPGNANLAITVGSTHREMPHNYGVSFFSSKGPTRDGRIKPDLVAPGERIISCAAGSKREQAISPHSSGNQSNNSNGSIPTHDYLEDSGTSMAVPHVSGVVAAFLSIRREFIGQPERVKEIFLDNATDLKRERYMQGHGLVDLMRAIQAI